MDELDLNQEQVVDTGYVGDQEYLSMSDEEIMNMDLFGNGLAPATEEEAEADSALEADPESDEEAEEAPEETLDETADDDTSEDEEEVAEADEEAPEDESEPTDDSEYKAQIEKLLAPFKANGREIKVESVDDAITLMKMGANYNKKMAALKPNLKIMRMLENQGLLSEEKLNFLIDLSKKKPEAISKLVKDSGLDPLDMNTDDAENYKPESYQVDDREIAIDEVLESIRDTETYAQTVDLVSNKWDESSRKVIIDNPEIIRVINDHKANGIFDQIATEMERDRMFGRLEGLSDLEAYKQVGDRLHAEGKFGSPEPAPKPANETVQPVKKPPANPQLANRKRAASTTRTKPVTKAATDFNPLAMSDEDFEKIAASKYF